MNTLRLALRNLLRNRRRSAATLLAMTIGGVSILLFGGYVQNIVYQMQTGYVRSAGHLQLQHRDYLLYGSGDPAAYGIADYERIIAQLEHDPVLAPMLRVITPTLQFDGVAGNFAAGASRTVSASGSVVSDQNTMRTWNDYALRGDPEQLSLTGSGPNAAVIGTGVARVLRLCAPLQVSDCPSPADTAPPVGSELPRDISALADAQAPPAGANGEQATELELLAATISGAPNIARLQVIKAEAQGVKEFDDVYVALHLPQAQRLLYGAGTPQVTAIELQLQHTDQIPAAMARVQTLLHGSLRTSPLAVYDFRALNPYYGQTIAMFDTIFGFMAVLIGAIVLFTVGNTMNAAVIERTVEIGTLRGMGLRRAGIRALFVAEGLQLGAVGALCGVVGALTLAALINHSGLTWTPPGRAAPVSLEVRLWGDAWLLCGTALALTLVAVLSAWWPARRAARLQVVEALRHA
jgi:putative ABC transport system permease protein